MHLFKNIREKILLYGIFIIYFNKKSTLNILEGQLDLISSSFHKKYLFDCFQIGKVEFPKVLFGSSPFVGQGSLKSAR